MIRVIQFGSADYDLEVALRTKILREPLGLKFTDEQLASENHDIHLGYFEGSTLLGCLILSPVTHSTVKMRQVAVAGAAQGTGVGRKLVEASEQLAKQRGFDVIELNARDTAIAFYLKLNYEVFGEEFLEVGIPHRSMRKLL